MAESSEELELFLSAAPAPPAMPLRIARLAGEPDCEVSDVAALAENDPLVAAKLVSLANSAMFGLKVEVDSVGEAVMRLGLIETRKAALTIAMSRTFEPIPTFDLRRFWTFSIASAVASEKLALGVRYEAPSRAYLATLVHRVADPVVEITNPGALQSAAELAQCEGCSWDDAILKRVGVGTPQLASAMLARWKFPAEIVSAVEFSHQPELHPEGSLLPWLIFAAAQVSLSVGLGPFDLGQSDTSWIETLPDSLRRQLPEPSDDRESELASEWEGLQHAGALVHALCADA